MKKTYNDHVSHLPNYLLDYVVDQNYGHYTPIDQAVWRYVMRQNVNYLPSVCHGSYLDGLKKTGLSTEEIPSMYGMTRILKDIGWYAVAVDGFIPPSVFMEFQANNVLVIAADIRQINHIGYTPAPDILHEAAGHAPIIADVEYANYLKKFGQIGAKAFSSSADIELFEAIRELSILKEAPQIDNQVIEKAENKVLQLQSQLTDLSEMARIRNLHWWTVEYGLIGTLANPKIYGAGLLSSISESVNCLSDKVKKLHYSIEASDVVFDITHEQPQLFVAKNFHHLNSVLDEFSKKMAFKKGGDYAIETAINSKQIATCEFDSGVQVSGVFCDLIKIDNKGVYLKTMGSTSLAYNNNELSGHGIEYHSEGFGAPIGKIINWNISVLKTQLNNKIEIKYDTGICVSGVLKNYVENKYGDLLIVSFSNCSVLLISDNDEDIMLFHPEWGDFDLIIGTSIVSAYPFPADRSSFPVKKQQFKSKTIRPVISSQMEDLNELYLIVRNMRENVLDKIVLMDVLETLKNHHITDWLLVLEICEITKGIYKDLYDDGYSYLIKLSNKYPENRKFILDGLKLLK